VVMAVNAGVSREPGGQQEDKPKPKARGGTNQEQTGQQEENPPVRPEGPEVGAEREPGKGGGAGVKTVKANGAIPKAAATVGGEKEGEDSEGGGSCAEEGKEPAAAEPGKVFAGAPFVEGPGGEAYGQERRGG